jgi:hemerythrin
MFGGIHMIAQSNDEVDEVGAVMRSGAILNTGVRSIDVQHQELVALIAQFEAAHGAGDSAKALDDVLPQLEIYVLFHFGEEERLMGALVGEAESVRAHLAQHQEFANQITQLSAERSHQGDASVAAALAGYLRKWLLHHIATTDVALSRKLLAKNPLLANH